jgi:hypothetical protein
VEWNKRRVASESELVRGGVMRSVLSVCNSTRRLPQKPQAQD